MVVVGVKRVGDGTIKAAACAGSPYGGRDIFVCGSDFGVKVNLLRKSF